LDELPLENLTGNAVVIDVSANALKNRDYQITIADIEAWELDFHLGNTVKYISRAGKKGTDKELQDLNKALWYLKRKIEILEKNGK
jgi:kynurenine formamidase